MDTRRIFTTILIAVALMFAYQYFMAPKNNGGAATQPVAFPAPTAATRAAEQGAVPITVRLGDPMGTADKVSILVNNITAGIDEVDLNVHQYAATVARKDPYQLLTETPGAPKPYSTLGIHITRGGEEIPLVTPIEDLKKLEEDVKKNNPDADAKALRDLQAAAKAARIYSDNSNALYATQYVWKVESRSPYKVVLLMTIDEGSTPLVEVRKIFTIDPATYDIRIEHDFKNLTKSSLTVAVDELTAPTLPRADLRIDDRVLSGGYLVSSNNVVKTDRTLLYHATLVKEATPSKPIGQMNNFATDPNLWVASSDRFFTSINRPLPESGNTATTRISTGETIAKPGHVASAEVDEIFKATAPEDNVYAIKFTGAPITLAAGADTTLPITAFLGPKDRNLLPTRGLFSTASAPKGSAQYDYQAYCYGDVIQFTTSGCVVYSYCSFTWLAVGLLTILDWVAKYITFHNYGIAIFILVIVVRAILHPLTKSSQISMATMAKKMNGIKPKIDATKKKYANDKKREQEETMRVYKDNNVNPAGSLMGCLPMLIQMPIWIAMYQGLWNDLDLRHAAFIPGWINDLAAPDALFALPAFTLPLLGKVQSFNLLPILLGVVFFFQMKIQTASQPKPADEQQAQMQKMSQWMFLILPLFLYNAPAGLNLYYFASTSAGLVDTYIVRKTLKKRGILPASAEILPTHQQDDDEDDNDGKKN
jgi:YidC/Oxa1 family membrane protein insertase